MSERLCRFCEAPLTVSFCDLGMSPLSNAYVKASDAHSMERFYPLHAFVCGQCFLVQLEEFEPPESIFGDYAYFSSYSESWLDHARRYADAITRRLALGPDSLVVEIASNDGYLLQYFQNQGIPVLGVEPARNVADAARAKGIPTVSEFFGTALARQLLAEGKRADLLIGNNVFAHVPALNDFIAGLARLLKPEGILTLEFPHLLSLIQDNQFDTIYHEHFSYFSLMTARRALERHGLAVFDVDRLSTHGGSLRVYAGLTAAGQPINARVRALEAEEQDAGLGQLEIYRAFEDQVRRTKREILAFLIEAKSRAKTVAGYGAPAKGNTLLNYCGIRSDFIDFTVDRSPYKQGTLLPGSRIPVRHPDAILEVKPDYLFILPWNLREEIVAQMTAIREWGGRFVVPIPKITVF